MTTANIDHASLEMLDAGVRLALANAEELCEEAQVLARRGRRARALFLHQISLEECAKIDTLGAWATSLLAGHEIDREKVLAAMRRHAGKNKTNAYMLTGSDEEYAAQARGDFATAVAEFKLRQQAFHQRSNEAKNAALYVDFVDNAFVAPAERITQDMLDEIAARNEHFLELMRPKARLLEILRANPEAHQARILKFIEAAEAMRNGNPPDKAAAMRELIASFLFDNPREGPPQANAVSEDN